MDAALATAAAIPLSLTLARLVPLNMLALPWYGFQQAGWLLLYALCFVLPFFCGALFITLAFMRWAAVIGRCYAADLAGSALGVILVLGCLIWDRFAVVIRSSTQQLRGIDYVSAAKAIIR